ncbi:MAG: BACON domain-containing protein, partial [Rikenellaceae bacterium]|nr:BACON domain-containing protein [Rikenellaceae bacterium]
MKRLLALLLLLSTITFTGCDIADVDFYERSYEVSAAGGEMIIPVNSTGIDGVRMSYVGSNNKDWCQIVEVIYYYEMTRALAEWDSGIKINFTPNNSGKQRTVRIIANSFGAEDRVIVRQPA